MNAYQRIKRGMRDNERAVKAHIRKYGKVSYELCGLSWMNAIDRLQKKGIIKYSATGFGYVLRGKRGNHDPLRISYAQPRGNVMPLVS